MAQRRRMSMIDKLLSLRSVGNPRISPDGKRVPIPNAYELRQGLEDQGVPVKMIVYKGAGHGLAKPKSIRAALEHNIEWFNRWIWGEESSGDISDQPSES